MTRICSVKWWDEGWKVYNGEYTIQIGACSVYHQVEGIDWQGAQDQSWYYSLEGIARRDDWIKALGNVSEDATDSRYTVDSTVEEIAKDSLIVRIMLKYFERMQAKTNGRGTVDYHVALRSANESPLRNVQNSFMIKGHFAQAVADFGNRKYFRGIWNLLR